MKILVVEDDPRQQEVARRLLKDHVLTVTASYMDAYHSMGDEQFDALLTDLYLPVDKEQSPLTNKSQEVEAGWPLVLRALATGINKIGLLTNTDHHQNSSSSLIDIFNFRWDGEPKDIRGAKVFLDNESCIEWCTGNGFERGDKRWDELLSKLL